MKIFNIQSYSKAVVLLGLISMLLMEMSCKKDLIIEKKTLQEKSQLSIAFNSLILGIDKTNGQVRLYKTTDDPNFLSEGSDILIHKRYVERIKAYSPIEVINAREINELMNKHKKNEYTLPSSCNLCNYNYVCIRRGVLVWPNGTVRLGFDPSLPDHIKYMVVDAMAIWREKTNISFEIIPWEETFIIAPNTYKMQVSFNNNSTIGEAQSTVGAPKNGESGKLIVDSKVRFRSIVHELGHAFGFVHEHQRPSRDQYITLQRQAIIDILPKIYDEENEIDFNDIEGSATPGGMYHKVIGLDIAQKEVVYNDNVYRAPFDTQSIMIYPSYGTDPRVKSILMQLNAPIYIDKYTGGLIGEPEVTDKNKMITDLDVKKVNTVYPLSN